MYDSNLTIDIDSTTNTTYHGTVVIATQNVSETSIGSAHTITVYDDPTGTISDAIRVVWTSGSRNYNVYFAPATWSKNLIHIRALGNYLENVDNSKICTQFTNGTAPTTTSGLTVVNALKDTFAAKSHGTHVSYGTSATAVGATAAAGEASTVSRSDHIHSLSKSVVTTALGYTPPISDTNTTYNLAASASSTNGNVQLNLTAGGSGSGTDSVTIKGSGATSVTTDASGVITISSTDNNTTYDVVSTTANGLAPKRDGSTSKFLRGDGTWSTLPAASGSAAGVTIVYPVASCTTFSSDSGTVTPAAVQKGAKKFSITRPIECTTSDPYPIAASTVHVNGIARWADTNCNIIDSPKITIEDVTNTKDTSKKANVLAIAAEGGKKMVYGYCTDQVDGTSFIGGVFDASATSYPYSSGLAIGGTSGNLLWKGKRVLDNDDLTTLNTAISDKAASSHTHTKSQISDFPIIPTVNNATLTIQKNGTNVATFTANSSTNATANITVPTGAAADKGVDTSISAASTSTNLPTSKAVAAFVEGKGYKTTDNNTTYTFATGDSNGQIKVTPSGGSAQNVSVKGLGSAAYTASTAYAAADHDHSTALINPAAIEMTPASTSAGNGGYIDFHFNKSSSDYTARIIESASGLLQVLASQGFKVPDSGWGGYFARNIIASTTDLTAGTSSLTQGNIYLVYE